MSTLSAAAPGARVARVSERPLAKWGPLAGLLILGAALRLSTLGLQNFWYDEAFSPPKNVKLTDTVKVTLWPEANAQLLDSILSRDSRLPGLNAST